MKIVINKCYGGFSLSPAATKRYAELIGRECFFFVHKWKENVYAPITFEEAKTQFSWCAYDIPNPAVHGDWHLMSDKEKDDFNEFDDKHSLYYRNIERTDPILVQVVEELGKEASGKYANLKIVEIPDDVKWKIDEYDGIESIHEVHRSW